MQFGICTESNPTLLLPSLLSSDCSLRLEANDTTQPLGHPAKEGSVGRLLELLDQVGVVLGVALGTEELASDAVLFPTNSLAYHPMYSFQPPLPSLPSLFFPNRTPGHTLPLYRFSNRLTKALACLISACSLASLVNLLKAGVLGKRLPLFFARRLVRTSWSWHSGRRASRGHSLRARWYCLAASCVAFVNYRTLGDG